VTITRISAISAVALAGALALGACGSDNNTGNAGNPGAGGAGGSATGGSGGTAASGDCFSGTLSAEGSSAQKNAIEAVVKSFQSKCPGATVNYNATGSGAGIKQFLAKQVDFGGSDSALKPDEAAAAKTACGSDAWNLPMVVGPVAISYNLKGVDKLTLNADVAAKIFNAQITTWNDPAVAALNPGVSLPAMPITLFFRSDDSGTTENFTSYFKAAAPSAWTAAPGKKWTGKGEGKPQNAGVASALAQTPGSISYLEWSFATQNKLGIAQVDTGSGAVTLNGESVGKAVAAAKQVGTGNDLALTLDYATKAPGAYPIVLVTYEIVCSKNADPAKGKNIKAFLKHFASDSTQKSLESIGYAPLPQEVQTKVLGAVSALG